MEQDHVAIQRGAPGALAGGDAGGAIRAFDMQGGDAGDNAECAALPQ